VAVIVRRIPPVACTITPCIDTRELVDQDGNNPTHRDIFSTPRRLRELDQQIADVDTQTDSVSELRDKSSLSQTSVTEFPVSNIRDRFSLVGICTSGIRPIGQLPVGLQSTLRDLFDGVFQNNKD
jgi:hypothetical protein